MQSYDKISQQANIEWELERVKEHIKNNTAKNIILYKIILLSLNVRSTNEY